MPILSYGNPAPWTELTHIPEAMLTALTKMPLLGKIPVLRGPIPFFGGAASLFQLHRKNKNRPYF